MTGPWTFDQAEEKCQGASRRQKAAEESLAEAAREFAKAEEAYRLKLAEAIIEIHAEGVAWTVAPDVARGRKDVAALRRDRDIKEGVREAFQQAAWRRGADRKDAQRFADWSMRREIAEGYGD
jgi:hypothetical protein